jgi:hypothetical protein
MAYYQSGGYPSHTNPAYAGTQEKHGRPGEVQIPVNNMQITRTAPKWSWCSTGWSIFANICCFSFCGFMGLLFSIWSYIDHKSGDYERASFKRRWSWGCAIFGMLLTLLVIIAALVIIFVFQDDICGSLDNKADWDFCSWEYGF